MAKSFNLLRAYVKCNIVYQMKYEWLIKQYERGDEMDFDKMVDMLSALKKPEKNEFEYEMNELRGRLTKELEEYKQRHDYNLVRLVHEMKSFIQSYDALEETQDLYDRVNRKMNKNETGENNDA